MLVGKQTLDEGCFLCAERRAEDIELVDLHLAAPNELTDLDSDHQWAYNPAEGKPTGKLTTDEPGWWILNPLINHNMKTGRPPDPNVPPPGRAHSHLPSGLAKNIDPAGM